MSAARGLKRAKSGSGKGPDRLRLWMNKADFPAYSAITASTALMVCWTAAIS